MTVRLHQGAIIMCSNPHCDETIGRLSKDLKPGDSRVCMESGFGQGARIDKLPHCKVCNFRWFVTAPDMARIHTMRGWYPSEQQMVAPLNA